MLARPCACGTVSKGDDPTISDTESRKNVIVYWRPWCHYCARLKRRLGSLGERATWINITQDAEGAAYVRSVNGGNEIVPTVVIDDVPHTNPSPRLVADHLSNV